ncbi:tyrosine--tRNA ligase, partial [bacterium]|nr:tyrosine--tRNA ligase [bacterium]
GSLVPIMALSHMQRSGHRVIALLGGGTAMIGDPSGKTRMRQIISTERIDENGEMLKKQFARFLDLSSDTALVLNNADWLRNLNYLEFLREIGRHFSVNKMLAAESYKQRLETGLNFIEFNYMLLQSYDFLHLYNNYDCKIQMGGNDQWGNILAGTDLIRRINGGDAEALTFPLLTTASGAKMGKTERGAIWLDSGKTSPYDYYQYWINTDDRDTERFLALFTFLPMDEVRELGALKGADIRKAKERLAFETTRILHGEEEARKAKGSAKALFSGKPGSDAGSVPTYRIERRILEEGIPAFILFADSGMVKSRGEARRLVKQGGAYLNDRSIEVFDRKITLGDIEGDALFLRAGKKKYLRVIIEEEK